MLLGLGQTRFLFAFACICDSSERPFKQIYQLILYFALHKVIHLEEIKHHITTFHYNDTMRFHIYFAERHFCPTSMLISL